MKRNFERSLSHVLEHEGGFVNHPRDPGGATNKGITIATFRRYVDRKGTIADLKALTIKQAGIVYKKQYWDKVRGDDLPNGLDYAVFDFAVNSGPSRAAQYLQNLVGVPQDGKIGPVTLMAVMEHNTRALIRNLCANRLAFLKRLKTWETFRRGWTVRVSAVETYALEWLGEVDRPPAPKTAEKQPQKPQIPKGLDKPMAKSKTLWSVLVGQGAGILTAFSALDWKVALPIVILIAVAGIVIFRERHRYAKQARKILAET